MNQKTYYHLVLDKSGSMGDWIHSTIAGYNVQLLRSLQERYRDQEIRMGFTHSTRKCSTPLVAKPRAGT